MRIVTGDKGCTGTHIAYMGFERRMNCGVADEYMLSRTGEKRRPLRWLVIWSRFEQVVTQSFHLQVRQRLLVLFLPMWSLQR